MYLYSPRRSLSRLCVYPEIFQNCERLLCASRAPAHTSSQSKRLSLFKRVMLLLFRNLLRTSASVCTECLWSVSAPVFVVLKAVGSKERGNHIKIYQCLTSYSAQPCSLPASSPSPPRSTPTPVPMSKTLISITVFVINRFFFCLFILYCSTYIVVFDWFVSYAFMSVGKLCTVTYPPNKPLNLKKSAL